MNMNGHEESDGRVRLVTECLPDAIRHRDVVEFGLPLHVTKHCAGEGPDLYIVGVWNGTRLQPLCHLQPLDVVLAEISKLFESVSLTKKEPLPAISKSQ